MTSYSINLSAEYKNFSINFFKKDESKKTIIYDVTCKNVKKHKCPYCKNENVTINKFYYMYLKNGINEDGYLEIFRVKIVDFKCISKDCRKTFKLDLPFRYKNYRITINVVKKILNLFKNVQIFSKIAKSVGVNEKIVKKICEEKMDEINKIEDQKNLENKVKHLCIDEKHISKKKGFYTIFYDFNRKKEILSCKGRNVETIKIFMDNFGDFFIKNIENVSLDMSKIYIYGVLKYIPNAKISIDNFHFFKNFNETLLKKIYKKLLKENSKNIKNVEILIKNEENKEFLDILNKTYNDLVDIRKLLIKNRSNLMKNKENINNEEDIEKLKKEFVEIKEIREIRDKIDDLKNIKDPNLINKSFDDLFEKYSKSDILEISKYCKKIKENYLEFLKNSYIFKISNGPIESFNRTIKQINNNGRGYKNVEMLLKIAKYVSNLNSLKYS